MKKFVSFLLVLIFLFNNLITVSAEDKNYEQKTITIIYGGRNFNVDIISDKDGNLYAPVDWMTYFGLYKCKETDENYFFFPLGQDDNLDFAKRICISKDGKRYNLSYYTDSEGLYKNQLIYQDSNFSKEMLNHLNLTYPNSTKYQTVFEGYFSNGFFINKTLYLPLAEILPFFNAKIGITENQELYISPNSISLSQAINSIDIADLAFNASSDMVGSDFISFSAYVIDTFNILDPRLDRFFGFGKENDYKTIFKSYLIDDEAYLSAFDEEVSPSSEYLQLGKELSLKGEFAASLVDFPNKLNEFLNKTKKLSISADSFFDVTSEFKKIDFGDIAKGAYKIFDYWYHYTNQVDDHRKMLSTVYSYSPIFKDLQLSVYNAAISTENLYRKFNSKTLLSITDQAMKDLAVDFMEVAAEYTLNIAPYSFAYEAARFFIPDFSNAIEQIENDALLYVIDESTTLSTNIYFDMRYSNKYTTESLENLRLCAILSLISSKHAYISLWGEDYNHPKVEKINEALKKLYLAADGIECESSDYYIKKKTELKKDLKNIKTQDSQNNEYDFYEAILGTWYATIGNVYGEMTFNADGTGSVTTEQIFHTFEWTIESDTLSLIMDSSMQFEYKIENDLLYLTLNGDTQTFTRKKNSSPSTPSKLEISNGPTIAAGFCFSAILKKDGSVVVRGYDSFEISNASSWPKDIVSISAGDTHLVGLRENGTVVASGNNDSGQCDVSSWTDIVAISAGGSHTVGLKSDGTVVAIGNNENNQLDVSDWSDIKQVAAGDAHTLGLKQDGTVVFVGLALSNGANISSWKNIISISANYRGAVALKSDGTVVGAENCSDFPDISKWSDIKQIAMGANHIVALRSDGTVFSEGTGIAGHADNFTDVIAISAGNCHTIALKSNGTLISVGDNIEGECDLSDITNVKIP